MCLSGEEVYRLKSNKLEQLIVNLQSREAVLRLETQKAEYYDDDASIAQYSHYSIVSDSVSGSMRRSSSS